MVLKTCNSEFPMPLYELETGAKFYFGKMVFRSPNGHLKYLKAPYWGPNFFIFKYRNIYLKRCVLKNKGLDKKIFWKIFNVAWVITKKLAKTAPFKRITVFVSFLVITQATLKIFSKFFFSWTTIFSTHLLRYIFLYFMRNFFSTSTRGFQ